MRAQTDALIEAVRTSERASTKLTQLVILLATEIAAANDVTKKQLVVVDDRIADVNGRLYDIASTIGGDIDDLYAALGDLSLTRWDRFRGWCRAKAAQLRGEE